MQKIETICVMFVLILILGFCLLKTNEILQGYGQAAQQGFRKLHVQSF